MSVRRETYNLTKGQKNKLKYSRNYERNKYYNEYNKTYKMIHFALLPEIYDEFDNLCKRLGYSKRDLILNEFEVFKNE
jgi:hypothetical protein